MRYKYDVFDLITCEYIAKGISAKEVHDRLGVYRNNVSVYCSAGKIYKDRYMIEKSNNSDEITSSLWKEWNKVRLEVNPNAKV